MTEQAERARPGEFDAEDSLAARQHHGHRPGRAELRIELGIGRAQVGTHCSRVGGASHVGGLIIPGQVGKTERDACAGARADVPELYDFDRLLRGQGRQGQHQPRVDLTGGQLVPGYIRDFDLGSGQRWRRRLSSFRPGPR